MEQTIFGFILKEDSITLRRHGEFTVDPRCIKLEMQPYESLSDVWKVMLSSYLECNKGIHLLGNHDQNLYEEYNTVSKAVRGMESLMSDYRGKTPWFYRINRPYLKLIQLKMEICILMGDHRGALAMGRKLLRRNPSDEQLIRHDMPELLRACGMNDEAESFEYIPKPFTPPNEKAQNSKIELLGLVEWRGCASVSNKAIFEPLPIQLENFWNMQSTES